MLPIGTLSLSIGAATRVTDADLAIDTEYQHRIAFAIARFSSRASRIWITCPVRIARAVAECGPGLRTLRMDSARASGTPSEAPRVNHYIVQAK